MTPRNSGPQPSSPACPSCLTSKPPMISKPSTLNSCSFSAILPKPTSLASCLQNTSQGKTWRRSRAIHANHLAGCTDNKQIMHGHRNHWRQSSMRSHSCILILLWQTSGKKKWLRCSQTLCLTKDSNGGWGCWGWTSSKCINLWPKRDRAVNRGRGSQDNTVDWVGKTIRGKWITRKANTQTIHVQVQNYKNNVSNVS